MDLIIPAQDLFLRRDQEGAVVVMGPPPVAVKGGGAEEKRRAGLAGKIQDTGLKGVSVLEKEGGGGFGPDDQIRARRSYLPGQIRVDLYRLFLVLRVPFDVLTDVTLDQGHPERLLLFGFLIKGHEPEVAINPRQRQEYHPGQNLLQGGFPLPPGHTRGQTEESDIDQHNQKRNPVDPGGIGDLH